jgi:RNA polymerase sporulation-specific sigma factor
MQSFPKPLSAKEEIEYIHRYENGDGEARKILIERNLRLVAYLVKKYANSEQSQEDLISIGTIGLIKAVDSYNRNKGVRLATYASRCIDNELLMTFRSSKKQAKEIYLYEPINGDDGEGNTIRLLDLLETTDEDVAERMENEENIKKLYQYIETSLTNREKEIIRFRYGIPPTQNCPEKEELTQREIAQKYGISRSYVSRIEKKALEKLRKAYESERTSHE